MPTLVPVTPSAPQESLRLAAAGEPGANLYNSYHFLTQISGLYAQAMQFDPEARAAREWQELCDLAIENLGELYHAWETALGEARGGKAPLIDAALGERVVRACHRIHEVSRLLNLWTPMPRWTRLLLLCEHKWLKFLAGFAAASPVIEAKLAPVRKGAELRVARLAALAERYRREAAEAAPGFAIVDAATLFGTGRGGA